MEALGEINIPAELRDHLALFVRLERKVLREYDEDICNIFDKLLASVIAANEGNPGEEAAGDPTNEQVSLPLRALPPMRYATPSS